ncbi:MULTISPECIES: hypothetical protein [unclassified Cedecea]|uniref:hypothetical protein n=1 Tax=unclassified Cedecea TaxID=2649846 RepID=UPI003018DE5E
MGAIDSDPAGGYKATITDASGREVLSFDLAATDRFILSSVDGKVTKRQLHKDDHYWSRATLMEVISEMTSKN